MANRNQRKLDKIKIIKLILLLAMIAIVIHIIYSVIKLVIVPTDVFLVKNDEICQEESCTGYIIREEVVVKGENYANGIVQIKSEGEKVSSGEIIFRYFNADENGINEKITELNN